MIQIYFHKKNFDAQKAERWFKERRMPAQMVDLARVKLGRRELDAFRREIPLGELIDRESAAWKECPARFAAGEEAILDALAQDPRRLRLPIVRSGKHSVSGFRPDIWETWQQGNAP